MAAGPSPVVVGALAGPVEIAEYRLEVQTGRGVSVLFRARDDRLGRLMALKIMEPGLAGLVP